MSSTPFGEHLKRERELRGVSLDEIAAATRIKTSFLEALENGRWDELPGGAFNRGFVRATAHFLGLDEDGMVAEYALETGGESQAKAPPQPSGAMPRDYRPALIAVSALLLLLIAARVVRAPPNFCATAETSRGRDDIGNISSAPRRERIGCLGHAGSPDGNPATPCGNLAWQNDKCFRKSAASSARFGCRLGKACVRTFEAEARNDQDSPHTSDRRRQSPF